jgi:hypothetical protein
MTDASATHDAPSPNSPPSAGVGVRDWFDDASFWIARWGWVLGALRGIQRVLAVAFLPVAAPAAFVDSVVGAGFDVVLYGVVGLVVASLVRALGVWAESKRVVDRGPSTDDALARTISRFAAAYEDRSAPEPTNGSLKDSAPQMETEAEYRVEAGVHLAEIRRLIREEDWEAADERVRAFRSDRPNDPRGAEVSEDLARARKAALEHLEARLQAARGVSDPDQVLEIHTRIQPLVEGDKRQSLDVDLARWFLVIVHRRLRVGRIQPDVVALADRVSATFGHTTEGASLRAALPTLRRSAGLCPRCAQPYTGVADACPACLAASPPAAPPISEPDELDEPPAENPDAEWFVDPSEESTE